MGRKVKIGKRRKDKYYHLAKETGYRARSAFKLIQLNRKYQFLQQCRVLVDLCAAPGGWLQVAAKFMPISSLIIGVDLVPIKSIPNVITFQEDITTDRCRQQLQRELKTWKVDCVLNDGAPNVGSAWVQDAFSQAELTLSALKLACAFLRDGGWFITKVFRSKDYQPLLLVLQQLFKRVHATKPQASRSESAEIFVVCQGYKAPKKVDPKLLDPRFVFADLEEEEKPEKKISLTKLQKPPKSAKGYDGEILWKTVSVVNFITGDDYLDVLSSSNKLVFDKTSEVFSKHPLTTDDIRQSCEDLKVLGPRELKQLVKWREKMRKFLDEAGSSDEGEEEVEGGGESEDDLEGIDEKIKSLEKSEAAEVKREIKRLRKQRKKLKERLSSKGDAHRETGELTRQEDLFRLANIKSQNQLEEVEKGEMVARGDGEEEDEEESNVGSEEEGEDEEEEDSDIEDVQFEETKFEEPANPLLVSLESSSMAANARLKKAKLWFSKSAFDGLDNDEDEDIELDQMVSKSSKAKNDRKTSTLNKVKEKVIVKDQNKEDCDLELSDGLESNVEEDSSSSGESDDSEEEERAIAQAKVAAKKRKSDLSSEKEAKENGSFEVVPAAKKIRKLDPEGLAIGALMVQSKKKREELVESGYNRWTHNDDNLPDWFVADESKYCQKTLPITKEMVEVYRAKLKEINSRPIKKIAEAKARKKKRAVRKLEKARKKAQSIADLGEDFTVQEKAQQIKQVYKKAGVLGKRKKEVEYVVAKRGVGKQVRRPAGVTGQFKVVDPRMKKDSRGKAAAAAKGRGQRSGGKGKRRH